MRSIMTDELISNSFGVKFHLPKTRYTVKPAYSGHPL